MLQQDEPDDYVLATGETHTVREFVERAFARGRPRDRLAGQGRRREGHRRAAPARCWSRSTRATSARPRSTLLLGDAAQGAQRSSAGRRRSASRSWSREMVDGRPRRRSSASARRSWTRHREASDEHESSRSTGKRVFVAGHRGMVGSALVRRLGARGLRDPDRRRAQRARPHAPGRRSRRWMRGDAAATPCSSPPPRSAASSPTTRYPADFLYDNLMIEANVIHAAHRRRRREAAVPRLVLHLSASSRRSRSREDALLTGPLEPTNEWYAIAKIAGIKLCQAYRRQYGARLHLARCRPTSTAPATTSTSRSSHVLPALIRKAHEAKARGAGEVDGLGHAARRGASSCTSTTCADACVFLLQHYSRRGARQRRLRRGPDDRRARRDWSPTSSASRARSRFDTDQARRHAAQAARRRRGSPRSAGGRGSRSRTASPQTYRWYLEQVVPDAA